MTTDAVRSLIREVLAEELGRLAQEGTAPVSRSEETVSVNSNADLNALVHHIIEISRDDAMREKIARGDHVFLLGNRQAHPAGEQKNQAVKASAQVSDDVVRIEEGFLSERRVETLPPGTRVVVVGQKVKFTPLARDRLRQRKITVERIK